jgi:hypothetical protein
VEDDRHHGARALDENAFDEFRGIAALHLHDRSPSQIDRRATAIETLLLIGPHIRLEPQARRGILEIDRRVVTPGALDDDQLAAEIRHFAAQLWRQPNGRATSQIRNGGETVRG